MVPRSRYFLLVLSVVLACWSQAAVSAGILVAAGAGAWRVAARTLVPQGAKIEAAAAGGGYVAVTAESVSILGRTVPMVSRQAVASAAAVAGVAAVFTGPVGAVLLGSASAGLQALADQMGVRRDSAGHVQGLDPGTSSVPYPAGVWCMDNGGCDGSYTHLLPPTIAAVGGACDNTAFNTLDGNRACVYYWMPGSTVGDVSQAQKAYFTYKGQSGNRCPNGGTPYGNGRCPSSAPPVPLSQSQAQAMVAPLLDSPPMGPGGAPAWAAPQLVQEAVDVGAPVAVDPSATSSLSGPAQVAGTPTTEVQTKADGTTVTTTHTPTADCVYVGGAVTCGVTDVASTVTAAPGGAVLDQSSTSKTTPPGAVSADDPCIKDAGRLGCVDATSVPEQTPVQAPYEFPFSFDPVDLAASESCPAPITVAGPHNLSIQLSFDGLCGVLAGPVRAILLFCASFIAIRQFIGGLSL